jgi:hypothetical protein
MNFKDASKAFRIQTFAFSWFEAREIRWDFIVIYVLDKNSASIPNEQPFLNAFFSNSEMNRMSARICCWRPLNFPHLIG